MTCEGLLEELRSCDFRVFGTGFVAESFWYALERHGLTDRVRGFLVSGGKTGTLFHGLPVQTVADGGIAPEEAVCLAVHEALVGEIRPLLAGRTDRIYPVYPYLTELCYGAPIGTEEWPLMKLLERQDPSYYWLTVRYAAARDYRFHRKTQQLSEELYVRAMAIHSSVSTAKKRLAFLHALIDGMAADGWRNDRPIFAEEDGRIVDGLHRTACAACLGIERVTVTVYPNSPAYDRLLGRQNRLPERVLRENGFSSDEMEFLDLAKNELLRSE